MFSDDVKRHDLKLNYKGSRDYIQGGDIYNACSELVDELFGSDFWINKIKFQGFVSAGAYITFDKNTVKKSDIKAFFTIEGLANIGYLIEMSTDVTLRIPYDESLVTDNTIVADDSIRQLCKSNFSAIEEVIALAKHFHNIKLPSINGQWIFTELILNRRLSKEPLRLIRLMKNLNDIYTVSEIVEDSNCLGKIKFTLFK